jgi:hypothetical protein
MSPRRVGRILLFCAAAVVALVLALLLGVKLVLDRAPEYQAQIKDWFYRQTGYHIAFAHVSPAFRWYGPELYFDRFELRSRDNSRVLAQADGGRVGLDVWRLLQSAQLFALRIEVDAPDITIDRLGPSSFAMAPDTVLGGGHGSLSALTMNDLPAGTLVIRRGFVTLRHWNEALPELKLRDVNLDLSRVSGALGVGLSAQLPAVLGGRLSFSATALGKGRLEELEWNALASASDMSFPGWRELLPEYLTRLDAGTGSFRAHATGKGADFERTELEFGAQGVITKLSDGANTKLEQVSGELALVHAARRFTLRRPPRPELGVRCELAGKRSRDAGVLRAGELSACRGPAPASRLDASEGHPRSAARGGADRRMDGHAPCAVAPRGERPLALRCAGEIPRGGVRAGGARPGTSRLKRLAGRQRDRRARRHRQPKCGVQLARSVSPADRLAGAQVDPLLET